MTIVWPDNREDQIQIVRQVYSDIGTLERQYVPATITDIVSPTEDQLQTAWDSVYDGAPQYASKVAQLDTVNEVINDNYSAIPYFARTVPALQRNWVMLDSYEYQEGDPVVDYDSVVLSQDYEKLVMLIKINTDRAFLASYFNVTINSLVDSGYDTTTLSVDGNRDLTPTSFTNVNIGTTNFRMQSIGGATADRPSSTHVWLEFPFYSNPDQLVEMYGSVAAAISDMDSTGGDDYYQLMEHTLVYGYYATAPVAVTQLSLAIGAGFLPGTNVQIFGVNQKSS
ncbi:MAG: hypothetical protein KAS32_11560 [Candidatus Peribacteraceae bacterium]|nr:hypothetical protein [Candidatus Peribacteraceae bacterium]